MDPETSTQRTAISSKLATSLNSKALKSLRLLHGKEKRRPVAKSRSFQLSYGDNEGGLWGEDVTRETLQRLVSREVLDAPEEQEVLFLCSVHKSKLLRYNIGGFVGGSAGERSRYLCVALELGPPANLLEDEEDVGAVRLPSGEAFVVVYYFTISTHPEYTVTIKCDVYLNDLVSVEYGAGMDFTLTFNQAPPLQLSAANAALRDEIVWNLLTINDVFCRGQVEARSVDLHGLSLTATTQNFLGRNEVLSKYMAAVLERDKSKLGGSSQMLLVDPFLNQQGNDEEVEGMLNAFKWPEQTVDDIDHQLREQLKQLERETIEVLLSWESSTQRATAAGMTPSGTADVQQGQGYLSTLQLVNMLDELGGELEMMETWLESKGDALKFMQNDMLEIEAENNRLERQWKNYSRLNAVLKPLILELTLDADSERILRDPAKHVTVAGHGDNADALLADRVDAIVTAARRLNDALNLLEGTSEGGSLDSTVKQQIQAAPQSARQSVMGAKKNVQAPTPKLKSIPKRLRSMEALKGQLQLLSSVRDDFVEKECKHMAGLFGKLVRPESLPGYTGKDAGSSTSRSTSILTSAALSGYQRLLHTKVLDYEPLMEMLALLLPGAACWPQALDDMLHAYAEAGSSTLYRPVLKVYFQQLSSRISSSSTRDSKCTLEGLPRANILDTSSVTQPLSPSDSSSLSPSLAIGQALTHLLPIVKREQLFVTEMFRLSPVDVEEDHRKLESVLSVEFDKLREKLTERAEAAADVEPLEGLAILAIMKQTLDPGQATTTTLETDDRFMSEMLISLQISLATKFNKFIAEQDTYIQHLERPIRRAGVFDPFAKFPTFVDRLLQAVRRRPIDIANAALQKLCSSLFSWLERSSQKDPKYADVVRLENYHFFAATMMTRQQRILALTEGTTTALTPYIEQAQHHFEACVQRYLTWMIEYQFPTLVAFFQRLEELVVKVGKGDVAIHVSKANMLKTMEQNSRKVIVDGLQTTHERLRKHISDDSNLVVPLWDRLTIMLVNRFARYEELVQSCYGHTFEPSAAAVRQLAQERKSVSTRGK